MKVKGVLGNYVMDAESANLLFIYAKQQKKTKKSEPIHPDILQCN